MVKRIAMTDLMNKTARRTIVQRDDGSATTGNNALGTGTDVMEERGERGTAMTDPTNKTARHAVHMDCSFARTRDASLTPQDATAPMIVPTVVMKKIVDHAMRDYIPMPPPFKNVTAAMILPTEAMKTIAQPSFQKQQVQHKQRMPQEQHLPHSCFTSMLSTSFTNIFNYDHP
jgi:hypothetical protein